MGFFYQAIKRATGQPVEEARPETARVKEEPAATASAVAVAAAPAVEPASVAIPTRVVDVPKQIFPLKGQIEKLVAFLTPPVLDPNIIAMEQCRVLRTRVWEVIRARKVKTLLVTSAIPEEGKAAKAIALIERIETFVRSQRPGLALTLNNSLGAHVEIERIGPKEIALKLV
ncbi:MAG: hypothetical protein ABIP12_00855, partial [Terriglobales bacterium]